MCTHEKEYSTEDLITLIGSVPEDIDLRNQELELAISYLNQKAQEDKKRLVLGLVFREAFATGPIWNEQPITHSTKIVTEMNSDLSLSKDVFIHSPFQQRISRIPLLHVSFVNDSPVNEELLVRFDVRPPNVDLVLSVFVDNMLLLDHRASNSIQIAIG